MDSTHIVAAGGTVFALPQLTSLLIWATTWPIHPLTTDTGSALAGLILMAGGALWPVIMARLSRQSLAKPKVLEETKL